jgi:hypothetical protein
MCLEKLFLVDESHHLSLESVAVKIRRKQASSVHSGREGLRAELVFSILNQQSDEDEHQCCRQHLGIADAHDTLRSKLLSERAHPSEHKTTDLLQENATEEARRSRKS